MFSSGGGGGDKVSGLVDRGLDHGAFWRLGKGEGKEGRMTTLVSEGGCGGW